ncbi:MAG: nucleotide pyrophosphohydrolase [Zoogloeaceae bacterium]|jgi:NTP pyrophosphatase (non-canonical NTP hydrolase)|nr:nucleotide pyrophosphohydrolase [Zoogloeaceae bacterium]
MTKTLTELQQDILDFRDARNWAQFHKTKDLMLSLALEAAEVLELAQWKSDAEMEDFCAQPESREKLADECADVLAYLLLLTDHAGIDLEEAFAAKLKRNAEKYPVEQCHGRREKYTRFQQRHEQAE